MRINRQTDTRAGFSLIEIMVALVVIAVGLIAIVGLIPQGIQSSRSAADNTLVATIVHDTFNGLRSQALATWPPAIITPIYYDAAATNATIAPQDWYYKVSMTSQSPTPSLLVVTATVTWPAKSPSPNSSVFVTQIANYQQ